MMHPSTELRWVSERAGHGIFARTLIPQGVLTWSREALEQLPETLDLPFEDLPLGHGRMCRLMFSDRSGRRVLLWDRGQFAGQVRDPSTGPAQDSHVSIAMRDIQAGEELTQDYCEFMGIDDFSYACGDEQDLRQTPPSAALPEQEQPMIKHLKRLDSEPTMPLIRFDLESAQNDYMK